MADSDIKLTVDLEPGDVTSAASELQKRIQQIFDKATDKELPKTFDSTAVSLARAYAQANKLLETITTLEQTPAPEYIELQESAKRIDTDLETARKTLADLKKELQNYVQIRGEGSKDKIVYTDTWLKALDALRDLKAERQQFINTKEDFESAFNNAPKEAQQLIHEVIDAYRELQARQEALKQSSGELWETFNKTGDEEIRSKYLKLDKQIAKIDNTLKSTVKNIDTVFEMAGIDIDMTAQEFFDAEKSIKIFDARVEEARQHLRDLKQADLKFTTVENTRQFTKLSESIEETTQKVNNLESEESKITDRLVEMEDTGKDVLAGQSEKYQELIDKLQLVNNSMGVYAAKAETMLSANEQSEVSTSTLVSRFQQLQAVISMLANRFGPAFSTFFASVQKVTGAVAKLTVKLGKVIGSNILKGVKKLASAFGNLHKKSNDANLSMSKIGKAIIMYGLGFRSLFRLVRKLRTALFEGFATLAIAYEPFNASMSQMTTALEYLKNSFAAAFAPIIQYVAPTLSLFITKMAEAVQMVGQFIAALTGKEFVMAMPVYKDYAESTSAGAKATKDAAKAAEADAKAEKKRAKALKETKLTIAGIDDVEILKDNSKDTDTSTSAGTPTLDNALASFQTAPISAVAQSFADAFKLMWKEANFYDIGKLIGEKLKALLETFNTNTPIIIEKVRQFVKSFTTALNGLLNVEGLFTEAGKAIANSVNIIFSALNEFVQNFDFNAFGTAIKDAVVGLADTLDWSTIMSAMAGLALGIANAINSALTDGTLFNAISTALSGIFNTLFTTIFTLVKKLEWGKIGAELGTSLSNAIRNINWNTAATALATFLNGLADFLYNLTVKTDWKMIAEKIVSAIGTFLNTFDGSKWIKLIGAFATNLFTFLSTLVAKVNWRQLGNSIVTTIGNGISALATNAKSFGTIVGNVATNIFNFLSGAIDGVDWISLPAKIVQFFEDFLSGVDWGKTAKAFFELLIKALGVILATLVGTGGALLKLGVDIVQGIFTGILDFMLGIVTWINDHVFEPLSDAIKKVFGISSPAKKMNIFGKHIINGLLNGIIDVLKNIGTWIKKHVFDPIGNGIKSVFGIKNNSAEKTKEFGSATIEGIKSGVTNKISSIANWLDTNVVTKFKNGLTTGFKIASGVAGKIKDIGTAAISGLYNGAKDKMSSVKNWMQTNVANPAHSALQSAFDVAGGVAKKIKGIGESVIEGVKSGISTKTSSLDTQTSNISSNMYKKLEAQKWINIGKTVITQLKTGMTNEVNKVYTTCTNLVTKLTQIIKSGSTWEDIGKYIIGKINYAFNWSSDVSNLKTNAQSLGTSIYNKIVDSSTWSNIGSNICSGINDGMWGAVNEWFADSCYDLGTRIYSEIKDALGIASPSKIMRKFVGPMIPAGIGLGIEDGVDDALDSVGSLTNKIVKSASNIKLPPIAMGEVIPYAIGNADADDVVTALQQVQDMLNFTQNNQITREELTEILTKMFKTYMNFSFSIGDEQIARHANAGNAMLNRRFNFGV